MTVRPVAQPPCRPPKGTKSGTFHWLRRELTGASEVAMWESRQWWLCGDPVRHPSRDLARDGWRYVRECRPRGARDE